MSATPRLGWTDAIVVVAGTRWDGVPSTERQLAQELAKQRPIVWVDPAMPIARAIRTGQPIRTISRLISPSIVRVTPVTVPGASRPVLRALATAQRRRALAGALRALDVRPAGIIVANLDDLLDVPGQAVRVFYGTDDYVAGAELMGVGQEFSLRAERRQLQKADVVLAVSESLRARWAALGAHPVLVPNGTDPNMGLATDLAQPSIDAALPSPVAGFVGHVSQRIDVALLEAVARRGISLLLVGPVTEGGPAGWDDLLKLPNVLAVGRQEHADLPSFYAAMDVGLTPYADTAFNRASYPLKTLEYLAAGLPVVSSDLPATHSLNSQLVVCAASPAAFASAVEKAAADAHEPALVQARRDLAAEHSWARRADQVLAAMGLSSSDAARSAPVARMGGDHR